MSMVPYDISEQWRTTTSGEWFCLYDQPDTWAERTVCSSFDEDMVQACQAWERARRRREAGE